MLNQLQKHISNLDHGKKISNGVLHDVSYPEGKKNHTSDRILRLFFVPTHISVFLIPKKYFFLELILKAPSLELLNFLHLSHHQIALDLQRISGTKWQEKWNPCWNFSWTCILTKVQWKMKEITSYKWLAVLD